MGSDRVPNLAEIRRLAGQVRDRLDGLAEQMARLRKELEGSGGGPRSGTEPGDVWGVDSGRRLGHVPSGLEMAPSIKPPPMPGQGPRKSSEGSSEESS